MSDSSAKLIAKYEKLQAPQRKKLGEILIEQAILTPCTVERVLILSKSSGRRFGAILEELGLVTGAELAQALANQYGHKVVGDFAKYAYPPEVLQALPMEAALEHTVFPLKIHGNSLALAMHDPTNEKIVDILAQDIQMKIHPFIATRRDILAAITRHYLKSDPVEEGGETILLVDADRFSQKATTSMLHSIGPKILVAADGMEAFNKAVLAKPALIITDKELPKLDGYTLLNALRNVPETRSIPVILVSAANTADEEAIACERGFFDFVGKPLKERLLKAKVQKALRSRTSLLVAN